MGRGERRAHPSKGLFSFTQPCPGVQRSSYSAHHKVYYQCISLWAQLLFLVVVNRDVKRIGSSQSWPEVTDCWGNSCFQISACFNSLLHLFAFAHAPLSSCLNLSFCHHSLSLSHSSTQGPPEWASAGLVITTTGRWRAWGGGLSRAKITTTTSNNNKLHNLRNNLNSCRAANLLLCLQPSKPTNHCAKQHNYEPITAVGLLWQILLAGGPGREGELPFGRQED